jgi:hypothetical protein
MYTLYRLYNRIAVVECICYLRILNHVEDNAKGCMQLFTLNKKALNARERIYTYVLKDAGTTYGLWYM